MTTTIQSKRQNSLEQFIANYNERTKTSKQISHSIRPTLADPRSSSGFHLPLKEMCYPMVAAKSFGSKIWDVDGNEYIDFTMGFGINLFGHNPHFIKEALLKQLDLGIAIGPQSQLAGEVAQLISELTGMERVTFSNTGTEAVMTAIRIARSVTKKNKIVIFSGSYHGHFDGTLVETKKINGDIQTVAQSPGIPPGIVQDVLVLKYDDQESLEIIKTLSSQISAVLVEPVQTSRPDIQPREFLHQLRELTEKTGILLIFDEMVTGFRIHPGGAQAWFGVQADIATYGKIVGGGLPLSVIAGKAVYLDTIDGGMWNYGDLSYPQVEKTFFAGTYCKHPLSLAAAKAVLEYLKSTGPALQNQLNEKTTLFVQKLNHCLEFWNLPVTIGNFGSIFDPILSNDFSSSDNANDFLGIDLLSYHLIHRGVLMRSGSGFLSLAHSDEDLEKVIKVIQDSLEQLKEDGFI